MGKRAVEVSSQLWQQVCTVGWRAGDKSVVECVKGLPEGATFRDVNVSDRGVITFIFEHPDWPETNPKHGIFVIGVEYRSYYNGARKAAEAVVARCGLGGQVRYEARPVTVEELAEIIQVALEDCKE